jgi:hypothetical protein
MQIEINLDFLTFSQQMIDKHGKNYSKQAREKRKFEKKT